MRKTVSTVLVFLLAAGAWSNAHAWTINFENGVGHDGEAIGSTIAGLSFKSVNGYDMYYGDATTGNYSVQSATIPGPAHFYIHDRAFAFSGFDPNAGNGRVDFDNQDGSYFSTYYSSDANFYLAAYDKDGNLLDTDGGAANADFDGGTEMGKLSVSSASHNMAYVVLAVVGNGWAVDDMSGDASGVADQSTPGAVPEPATMLLFGLGLVGGAIRKRMQK